MSSLSTSFIVIYSEFAICGIGVHHAGMDLDDRRATEELYLAKLLRVVVATSVCYSEINWKKMLIQHEIQTLAVGVNLRK